MFIVVVICIVGIARYYFVSSAFLRAFVTISYSVCVFSYGSFVASHNSHKLRAHHFSFSVHPFNAWMSLILIQFLVNASFLPSPFITSTKFHLSCQHVLLQYILRSPLCVGCLVLWLCPRDECKDVRQFIFVCVTVSSW